MTTGSAPRPNLDSVTTIRADGSRRMIHPADVTGRVTRLRMLAGLCLLFVYVALPWIPINGNPAVFLDVASRRFHYFGWTLATQDLWLGFFLITGWGFILFYITALLGRVWCGWMCPQTVFLDIIRRVERWTDGDATARRRLDAAPWTLGKTLRRFLKHGFYAGFSLLLAHVFLSYFVSLPKLYAMMQHAPWSNWPSFLFVFLMAAALWFDFAWFREQFCIVLCPYGRIQSALTDDDTLNVGYDKLRGEPRGKASNPANGHCVDCLRCVSVCPTGIDIRQGLQMECIGCAACVDACDDIMEKLHRPAGLIRYDSLNGFARRSRRFLRPRMIVYTLLGIVGASAMTWAFSTLRPMNVSLTRMTGAPYVSLGGTVRNQYLVRVLNKRHTEQVFCLEVLDAPASLHIEGTTEPLIVAAEAESLRPVVVTLPRAEYGGQFKVRLRVHAADGAVVERDITFLGPTL